MLLAWGAVAADHYDRLYHPKIVEKTVTVTEPYAFAWQETNPRVNRSLGSIFAGKK